MNYVKTILFSAFAAIALTSCLGDSDEDENTYTAWGYYTITGNYSSSYTLYSDMGGKVIPTMSSVSQLTNNEGFGNHSRAMLYFRYKPTQVSADEKTITGAELFDGRYFDEYYPMSQEQANNAKVTDPDSIFQFRELMDIWAYRGYLNAVVEAPYSYVNGTNIKPTVYLVYDPASITENSITFNFYFNRHSDKTAPSNGPVYFYTSFYLNLVDELVPGNGDVNITVKYNDGSSKQTKVSRENLRKGNYE